MSTQTDQQLLRDYLENRDESAFAELVRRHVDMVYSAALRRVCDTHQAQDVAQGTFSALAQNARHLTHHPVLSGWLHRTTQNIAANLVRSNIRRQAREQEAVTMNELLSAAPDAGWEAIAPHLDAALDDLETADRDAVMLRYFEKKSAQEIAAIVGVSVDAAQKRVSRAVERLREFFSKRGIGIGASGLTIAVSANAVQAAPVGLAVAISTATALAGTTITTTATVTATTAIAMTAIQKTIITATIAALAGVGIYQARQTSQLREQVHALQQERAPLTEQLVQFKAENERLSNQVASARNPESLSREQVNELLNLRGKSAVAQADSRELARLKSTLAAQQTAGMPDYFSNAIAMGIGTAEKFKIKDSQAKLARMKESLSLTDAQTQAIGDVQQKHIKRTIEMSLQAMTGKNTQALQQAGAENEVSEEDEIKGLLTPGQLAAYPEYKQGEKMDAADKSASGDAKRIAGDFNLSKEQEAQIHAAFLQMNLTEPTDRAGKETLAAAKKSGDFAGVLTMKMDASKAQLEERLQILGNILTPEQLDAYRKEQMGKLDMLASAMKMVVPQKPAGTTN